jgi:hypothetical protein
MKNWRQILGWRKELTIPNGFGKSVICHSSEYLGKDYVGVCIYQGKGVGEEELTYALWTDEATDDQGDLDNALDYIFREFYEKEEEYLQKVQEVLELPDSVARHLALNRIPGVSWLYTVKCEFLNKGDL